MLRLKVKRQEEQRINKVKDLMEMFRVPSISYPTYQYQPIGASSLASNNNNFPNDPRIQAAKGLFEMFHLAR